MDDTSLPIYIDNHATTRVDPRVMQAMLPFFTETYGNASSVNHAFGWQAAEAVARARQQVAELLNAEPRSIVFTSGATEANNLAIKGTMWAGGQGSHFITNTAEHRAVLDPAGRLRHAGFETTLLPVNRLGMVDSQQVADAIRPTTRLVSIMMANNEVGTVNPVREIGRRCHERNVLFHTDAVQAVGKISVDLSALPVDLLSLTAHKMYGPKGVGGLYVRRDASRRINLEPLFDGGGHERHLRSGTLAVPLIVGFGEACALSAECRERESKRVLQLKEKLFSGLKERLDGIFLNGHPDIRLPGNLNVSFEGVDGEALMMGLKTIAVSSGSACTTAEPEPSHVLRAMGVNDVLTRASLRFGLGRYNTDDDVDAAINEVADVVRRLRNLAGG